MTKIEQAKHIVEKHHTSKDRKDIIALISKKVGVAETTASTYYSMAKRALEETGDGKAEEEVTIVNKPEVFDAGVKLEVKEELGKVVEKFFQKKKMNGNIKAITHSKTKMVIRIDVEGKF